MQGIWVRPLTLEDTTCCRPTKPVHHNYWAYTLEPAGCNYRAHEAQLLCTPEPVLRKRKHLNEKPENHNEQQPLLSATR